VLEAVSAIRAQQDRRAMISEARVQRFMLAVAVTAAVAFIGHALGLW